MKFFRMIRIADHKKTMLLGLLAMISLTAVLSVGPIYAYLKMTAGPTVNKFDASPSAALSVNSDYTIKVNNTSINTSDPGYSVYVRATVVVTWRNSDGEVYGKAPNYSIPVNNANWTKTGDYYYYNSPVGSGESTEALLTGDVTTSDTAPDGYSLNVDILAQSIQAVGQKNGTSAVRDAWGIDLAG